ncbi:MAG: DNA replication and repair protein RecF, partial [Candidatus Contendobacter sp.]
EPFAHDFAAWLRAGRAQDRQQGHTRLGPHRADFIPRLAGRPPAEVLSRGQQKLLVIALVLAQAELYRRHAGDACILLIDDLSAELDPLNRTRVVQALAALDGQLFVTAIEPDALALGSWPEARIFQLCQGRISRL